MGLGWRFLQLNEEVIKGQLKELVRGSVEETLNELLEAEANKLTQAARYERNEQRQGYRSGHYNRNLTTTSGDVTLKVTKLKGISFETAIIERYRRRESSVEEALIEMYLAGVSVRRVEDITEALWGSKVSPSTISELNKKAYVHIEDWRNRPLQGGRYPYVYVDGIYLRRNWGGEFENVAILVAIAVNEDGYREVLGAAEGMKEDKASWVNFFQWLRGRGLDGVKLVVGDKCLGMLEAVGEVFPEAKYQRCTVHFYRNVFAVTPRSKAKLVAKMLKAIHAQESKKAAREKAKAVVEELRSMKLKEAAKKVEDGIEETLTYCDFPSEHWTRIRTNNVIERLNREIRRHLNHQLPQGRVLLVLPAGVLTLVLHMTAQLGQQRGQPALEHLFLGIHRTAQTGNRTQRIGFGGEDAQIQGSLHQPLDGGAHGLDAVGQAGQQADCLAGGGGIHGGIGKRRILHLEEEGRVGDVILIAQRFFHLGNAGACRSGIGHYDGGGALHGDGVALQAAVHIRQTQIGPSGQILQHTAHEHVGVGAALVDLVAGVTTGQAAHRDLQGGTGKGSPR